MRGYLNKEEIECINGFIGDQIIDVRYYYYDLVRTKSLDYIEIILLNAKSLILTFGSLGEDISLAKNEALKANDLEVEDQLKDENWSKVINQKILGFELKDYKGYCHNSIIFFLENSTFEIYAGLDYVNVTFDLNKIGKLYPPNWRDVWG